MHAKLLLSFVCLNALSVNLFAKTRTQVVADGISMVTTSMWTATNNSYSFGDITFKSHFSTGVVYSVWPYVYGGKEASQTTVSRINGGTSPGGRNVDQDTPETTEWLYDNGYWPAQHLAGIDCSGFACRALGYIEDINNVNTTKLAELSVGINAANMKKGDLLIIPGSHVRLIVSPNPLEVVEAFGSNVGYARQVSVSVGSYGVYSPFPVFSDFIPSSGTVIADVAPEIKVKVKSGTPVKLGSIVMVVDADTPGERVFVSAELAVASGNNDIVVEVVGC